MIATQKRQKRRIPATTAKRPRGSALGYRAATVARNGPSPAPTNMTGDHHVRTDRPTLVAEARAALRDNAIFAAAVQRMGDNVIGPAGFKLQARVQASGKSRRAAREAERLNDQVETLWADWAEDPEVRGLYDWAELQRLVFEDMLVAGDIGAIKLSGGQLQVVESERITGPYNSEIEQGILLNKFGRPVKFYLGRESMRTTIGLSDLRAVSARRFIYAHGPARRISQTRPVPAFVSSMSNINRLEDILNAEAVAWQILSRHAVAITKQSAAQDAYADSEQDTDRDVDAGDFADRCIETPYGLVFWGEHGDDVKGINHDIPGGNFSDNVVMYLRLIGMQVGLPLELLLLDWTKTNFSSARAALEQAWITMRRWQQVIMSQWHRPIYRWQVSRWIRQGQLPNRPDMYRHTWIPAPFPWVDIEREARARGVLLDRGVVTYDDMLRSEGKEFSDENDRRERVIRDAIGRAQMIKDETGVDVPWEHFSGYEPGKTMLANREQNTQPGDTDQ